MERLDEIFAEVAATACQPGSKAARPGNPPADPVKRTNRNGKNGSGGIIVIDFDAKNGADRKLLERAFPGIAETPTREISTASEGGRHLVYRWTDRRYPRFDLASVKLVPGVEVPPRYMMFGSKVNGVRYSSVNRLPAADLPPELTAVLVGDFVEPGYGQELDVDVHPQAGVSDAHNEAKARKLLDWFAVYEPGKTNEKFTRIALPVIELLGPERAADELGLAWPNKADAGDEIARRIASAIRESGQAAPQAAPRQQKRYSKLRRQIALNLLDEARYGRWEGSTAKTDRRVYLGVLLRVLDENELVVRYPAETLANHVGIKPADVRKALRRLDGVQKLTIVGDDQISVACSEMVRLTVKGEHPLEGNVGASQGTTLSAVDMVWRSPGLRGRHAHLFDLIDAGVGAKPELASHSGASRSTVKETVDELISAGLIVDEDGHLTVATGIEDLVRDLRLRAVAAYDNVARGIDNDHHRLDELHKAKQQRIQDQIDQAWQASRDPRREAEEHGIDF